MMPKKKSLAPAPAPAPASAGAVETDSNAKDSNAKEPEKQPPRYYSFKYVVQSDFSEQMAVHNWLSSDPHFRVVWILHDRDTYSQRDVEEHPKDWKDGVYTRKNGDGSESQFRIGDTKPAHIHGYVRVQNKVTESTMKKRFGGYVRFFGVADSYATLIYFTHSDFVSQVIDKKFQYPETDLRGDMDLYRDNCKKIQISDNFGVMIVTYQQYVDKYGSATAAVSALVRDGRLDVVSDIRKNSAFYDRFIARKRVDFRADRQEIENVDSGADPPAPAPAPQEIENVDSGADTPAPAPAPQEITMGIYGAGDARNAPEKVQCVCCGGFLRVACFRRTWPEKGVLVGVCVPCTQGGEPK